MNTTHMPTCRQMLRSQHPESALRTQAQRRSIRCAVLRCVHAGSVYYDSVRPAPPSLQPPVSSRAHVMMTRYVSSSSTSTSTIMTTKFRIPPASTAAQSVLIPTSSEQQLPSHSRRTRLLDELFRLLCHGLERLGRLVCVFVQIVEHAAWVVEKEKRFISSEPTSSTSLPPAAEAKRTRSASPARC